MNLYMLTQDMLYPQRKIIFKRVLKRKSPMKDLKKDTIKGARLNHLAVNFAEKHTINNGCSNNILETVEIQTLSMQKHN